MRLAIILLFSSLASLAGCRYESCDPARQNCSVHRDPFPFLSNPQVECYWDDLYLDYAWSFQARSEYTYEVWADVHDDLGYIESFPLYEERIDTWSSTWLERETLLFCGDFYYIDFVAIDRWGNEDILTVEF